MFAFSSRPAAIFAPGGGLRRALAVGLLVGLPFLQAERPGKADEAEPGPALEDSPEFLGDDARLCWLARRAFLQDEVLAPLNLGVRIRQGVATLWGSAPTEDVVRRALE